MSYYDPQDAGGNVFTTPKKNLRRSAAHQLVPPGVQTKEDRTVDHISANQLFEDGGLGSNATPSMPEELSRRSGIDTLRIPAGDLSRSNTRAVKKAVQNLEYMNRMSNPNIRSVPGEPTLKSYNERPTPLSPGNPTPGPGAIFHKHSLERLAGRSQMPVPGYTPGLGPKALADRRALLNPTAGTTAKNADALANTLESLPKSAMESLYIPNKAIDAMTITRETGIPETRETVGRYGTFPKGIKEDGSGNAAYLSQAIQMRKANVALPKNQPAQTHPAKQNYEHSDGQFRGLGEVGSEPGTRKYDKKKLAVLGGLGVLGAIGIYLATRS